MTFQIIRYLFCILMTVFCRFGSFAQKAQIDSLTAILDNCKVDSVRCNILNELFEIVSEGDKSTYNTQLKTIAENNLEKNRNPIFYKGQLAISLNNLGIINADRGDIIKALDYCNQSLKMMEEIGNKKGIAQALYQISEIHIVQGDYIKSFSYSQRSLKLMEEIGYKKGMADCSEDIGNYFEFGEKDFEKALEVYQKGLKLSEQINYKKRAAYLQGNIARVYLKLDLFTEALDYNLKSLKTKEEIGDKKGAGYSLHKIGHVYLKQGDFKLAFEYGKKSMDLAKELGFPESIKRSAELLNLVYKKQGDYKNASEMYELYIVMRDSINNIALQKAALQKQLQFEYEQQKLANKAEQEKKDAIGKEQEKKQKIITWSIFTFLILVLLFAAFIFRSLRLTNHQKKVIEEKQKDILDSIRYAKRIQTSLLPTEKYIEKIVGRRKTLKSGSEPETNKSTGDQLT